MKLAKADREFLWHPYTQMRDWASWNIRLVSEGRGFSLIDEKGSELLDGVANMWCNVWGHDQNNVTEAMVAQIRKIPHSTLFGLASASSASLSRRLVGYAKGMAKVFFTDNGSTAIEASLKMALQYWKNKGKEGKTRFVSLEKGYHGDTVGSMSVGYLESFFGSYKPLLFQVIQIPNPFGVQGSQSNEGGAAANCLKSIENTLKQQSSKCAAVIMESGAQVAGGAIIYPFGFQRAVSELCDQYDVLLIIDEIATGFGRLGNFMEYIAQRCKPDIICFGKALTAGYFPLAATLVTQEVFDAFNGDFFERKQFYHGHTFAGHNVGCTAAMANFDMYEDRNLIRHIRMTSQHLHTRLDEFKKYSIVSDIRHSGLLVGIELAREGKALSRLASGQPVNYFIMKEAQKLGVFMRPLANVIMFVPPLAMDIPELDRLINVGLSLTKRIQVLC